MPHMNKLSNYRTTFQGDNNKGQVVYVNTTVVFWDENCIQLRSGGYETVTTKRKMNQTSNQFDLDFGVYQKDYEWFVDTPKGETLPFFDGIIIDRKVKL